ncbi:MAG: LptF/LptG family permease [Verrucomicrobiota bacterium]
MRVINKYIAHDFLATMVPAVLVFTFVMCVGAVFKAIDLLARGVSGGLILQVFAYNIPFILTFSIPMSVLTAVLLQFSRMSLDGEITAMKASGLSIWQIISPVIMISIVLSMVCVYLNDSLAPRSHWAQRRVLVKIGVEEPINLLEEGRFVRDFPGLQVYVAKKDRQQVTDVVVYELGEEGVVRNVRAKTGTIRNDPKARALVIDLYDVRIDQPDPERPMDPTRTRYVNAKHYPVKLSYEELLDKGKVSQKTADMTYLELIRAIRDIRGAFPHLQYDDLRRQRMSMVVESNKRLALSLSCFAFALLGVPLGMRSRRRESSVGVGISLLLVFFFYFFIILANSLVDRPQWRPDIIVWIPVLLAEFAGFYLIYRAN